MLGVAFRLKRYQTEWTQESSTLACDNPDHVYDCVDEQDDQAHDEACYLYDEPEEIENRDFVIAVMVGDDREHVIDVSDLTEISDAGYCRDCGQTGCTSNVCE